MYISAHSLSQMKPQALWLNSTICGICCRFSPRLGPSLTQLHQRFWCKSALCVFPPFHRYIPRFLWMKLPTVHADCFFFSSTQIIPHLSKRKVTLYLMRCCNLFFLTSVMNMKFCRYEGTYPYFLIIWCWFIFWYFEAHSVFTVTVLHVQRLVLFRSEHVWKASNALNVYTDDLCSGKLRINIFI